MIVSCFRSILCSSLLSKPIYCRRYRWSYPPNPYFPPTLQELQYGLINIKGRDSPRPKRPLSAFFRFYMDNKDKLRDEHPGVIRQHGVIRLATAIWYGLPAEARKPYEDRYAEEIKEYKKAIILYRESISPEEAEEIKELRQRLKKRKQEIKLKKLLKHLNRPKPPMDKFLLFCKEQMEKELPPKEQNVRKLLRKYRKMWKKISEEEKWKYEEQFYHLQNEYQEHISKWEEKMIKQIDFDVIKDKLNIYSHVELKND